VAGRLKVVDLAKELGVTSKDLIVALESMGHKGMRAMSPLVAATANELRVKLGRGRELPTEPKPKRAPKPKEAVVAEDAAEVLSPPKAPAEVGGEATKRPSKPPSKIGRVELEPEPPIEAAKPAATIFRPAPAPVEAVDVPVVAAPVGVESIGLTHGATAMIGDDAPVFAAAVLALYQDRDLWLAVRTNARQSIDEQYLVKQFGRRLDNLLNGGRP